LTPGRECLQSHGEAPYREPMDRPFVVIGAGLCGGTAVHTLRQEGFDGGIVLVGEEPDPPYERPPLSKEYLRGEQSLDSLFLQPSSWYEEHRVELLLGTRAVTIDPDERVVELSNGDRLAYEAVLIATGGRPRQLPGEPLDRVLYLRTISDADGIRSVLTGARHLVVVGAGFIGAEVAASARTLGLEVTCLEMLEVPLERALGKEMGALYAEIHREHGVDLRTGEGVETIEQTGGGVVVRTTRGASIEGDAVVVGVGIQANTELGESAGARIDNGIVVDEFCRTSVDGVFAAGDVANHRHPVFDRHVRVEHFDNAIKHGAAAARSMMGKGEPYADPHWFWSDQYDLNLQYAGYAASWDEVVVRGSTEERNFVAFYLSEGVILAALGLNRGKDVRRAIKLISGKVRPDPKLLRDEDADLRKLA
jgi:3-phenylpropionate/trans-cinnamate dioxygenase ferredoxin reductase component